MKDHDQKLSEYDLLVPCATLPVPCHTPDTPSPSLMLATVSGEDMQDRADRWVIIQHCPVSATDSPCYLAYLSPPSPLASCYSAYFRTLLTPWVKFLWEVYRHVLDILKNNNKVEKLYQDMAQLGEYSWAD